MSSFSHEHFAKGGFISLPDEDGEQNYIPVTNIDCLELDRAFIYPDETWEDLENMRRLEDNKNVWRSGKKLYSHLHLSASN